MALIELVFDEGCPHVDAAREQLRRALDEIGLSPEWSELVSSDPSLPEHARGYGSPSILVDGKDVAGGDRGGASCCRVYRDEAGALTHIPTRAEIVDALLKAGAGRT